MPAQTPSEFMGIGPDAAGDCSGSVGSVGRFGYAAADARGARKTLLSA
jgi:hypothetical protein